MSETDLTEIRELLETPKPPELGPGPRAGVQTQAALNRKMDEIFGRAKCPPQTQALIRGLILLWHDHLDAAHAIAQDIPTSDGALIHAIMHRREPEYGNAKYWFRRVGRHGCFPEIVERVKQLPQSKGDPRIQNELISKGEWDPFAFVDGCEREESGSGPFKDELRAIQAIETAALLEWFCSR
jgi:hypothetical protein